jgi:DNA phosphorothioation system restriction enzyme
VLEASRDIFGQARSRNTGQCGVRERSDLDLFVLSGIRIKPSYRSGGSHYLVGDFYEPCLVETILYRRAVGYFTSYGLALAARGVASLVHRGGKMRLVASPALEEGDLAALELATNSPQDVLRQVAMRGLDRIADYLATERLNALAWLAASGALEVKLAVRRSASGDYTRGIYHEKIGIFSDAEDNHVAFTGSSNETAGGLVDNFESVEVFWSWDDPHGRVQDKIDHFESLWSNAVSGLEVLDFTDVSSDLLRKYKLPTPPKAEEEASAYIAEPQVRKGFNLPAAFTPREYQKEAIRAWFTNQGRGILAMATGTGKTLTALTLSQLVYRNNKPLVIVVVCPYLNLCEQWMREVESFGVRALGCFGNSTDWTGRLQDAYQALQAGVRDLQVLVTTNATFSGAAFRNSLHPELCHHLLIADEMHNLGAGHIREALPGGVKMRLGLSATPERHHDFEGSQALSDYFSEIVYEFPLKRAIEEGFLVPYYYHPVLVKLTEEEAERYITLTRQISWAMRGSDDDEPPNQELMALLMRRSRLLGSAANKLPVLIDVLKNLKSPVRQAIFYCGDGSVECEISGELTRQIKALTNLLHSEVGLRTRQFTYEESPAEREDILGRLRTGNLDGIVAIRCLDEGIDLPDVRMGFLMASSTNPRQFIQRRGRLLRKAPGKHHATIYDFIVEPAGLDSDHDTEVFNVERRLFRRELARIVEFCETAINGPTALGVVRDLRVRFNLLGGSLE